MKQIIGLFVCAVVGVLPTAVLAADGFEVGSPASPDTTTPQLIGADPADPADWPATLVFLSNGSACTSTAVGARVVLTAAHCVENGSSGDVTVASGAEVTLTCDHHPAYPFDLASDLALCIAASPLQGMTFERVSADLSLTYPGRDLILLGYGCTEEGGVDRSFGVLHEGTAPIQPASSPPSAFVVTKGGPAVCYGDSGGAAYAVTSPDGAAQQRRAIVGVNSRGDISSWSLIAPTARTAFVDWALEWAAGHEVEICGLHRAAEFCRP